MKYLIFTNELFAQQRADKATEDCNFTDGITKNYCNVLKHPTEDKWAIIIDKTYLHIFTEQELNNSQELTEDWFN